MEILEGKIVAENIKKDFEDKIRILNEKGIIPHIAVLGICGDDASRTYIKRIEPIPHIKLLLSDIYFPIENASLL